MSITRINKFEAAPNKAEELDGFLKSILPYISSCEGSLSCEILRDVENKNKFAVIEKWENIESHKKSVEAFPQETMMSAMVLFAAMPEGSYYQA
jgi:quinol monooxygenase YgiN